jgi:sec-independent protein translocase protein TatB
MFDIGYSELLVVAVVALIVIGPKDLPRVMRTVGQWVGRARGMARHFRSGIDTMIRESELEEMEKKWREENERIMREHPVATSWDDPLALPPATPAAESGAAAGDTQDDGMAAQAQEVPPYAPDDAAEPTSPSGADAPRQGSDADSTQLSFLPPEPGTNDAPAGGAEGPSRPLP